jgi:hypothetical protein
LRTSRVIEVVDDNFFVWRINRQCPTG